MTTLTQPTFRFAIGTLTNHGRIVGRFIAPTGVRIYVLSDTMTTSHWAESQLIEGAP